MKALILTYTFLYSALYSAISFADDWYLYETLWSTDGTEISIDYKKREGTKHSSASQLHFHLHNPFLYKNSVAKVIVQNLWEDGQQDLAQTSLNYTNGKLTGRLSKAIKLKKSNCHSCQVVNATRQKVIITIDGEYLIDSFSGRKYFTTKL